MECTFSAPFALPSEGVTVYEVVQPENDEGHTRLHIDDFKVTSYGFVFDGTWEDTFAYIDVPGHGTWNFDWKNGRCAVAIEQDSTLIRGRIDPAPPAERSVWIVGCGTVLDRNPEIHPDGTFEAYITSTVPCALRVSYGENELGAPVDIAPAPGAVVENIVLPDL